MKRPLKQLARKHFEKPALSSNQLDRLEALISDTTLETSQSKPAYIPWLRLGAVAAIAMIISTFFLSQTNTVNDLPMMEKIALEVALNHIKLKPLDVKTNNIEGLRRYFSDLEFVPAESQLLASINLDILGGRYCSIQQVSAAQIRISRPNSAKLKTLYQTEYIKDVFGPLPILENGDQPVAVNVKGLQVQIWVEKGLLFALTEEAGLEAIRLNLE